MRIAFADKPFVRCSIDAVARMLSLIDGDVLEIGELTRFEELHPELAVQKRRSFSWRNEGRTTSLLLKRSAAPIVMRAAVEVPKAGRSCTA